MANDINISVGVFAGDALRDLARVQHQVQGVGNRISSTTKVLNQHEHAYNSVAVATNKWAKGALQQAGYQVGDFFLQVTNGTNAMQAFGQQGSQLLGIFGPIGAVAGAAVSIFAAFAVAMERSGAGASDLNDALSSLKETSSSLTSQMEMLRFGVDTEAEAQSLRWILNLRQQIASKTAEYTNTDRLESRQLLAEQIIGLKRELYAQEQIVKEIEKKREALRTANMINRGMQAVELGHARAMGQAEAHRIARAMAIYGQMIAIQNAQQFQVTSQAKFNERLSQSYIQMGKLLRESVKVRAELDAMANAAIDPQRFKLMGAYQLYASTRMAAPDVPPEPPKGGGAKTDPLKELRDQLALEEMLIGKTEAQRRVIQALGVDWKSYGSATLKSLVDQINRMSELNVLAERQQEIANVIEDSMSSAFMAMVDGTKSVKEAFRDMARSIIMKLYEVLVVQQMVNSILGFLGFSAGSTAPLSKIPGMARGGPITGGKPYIVGEKGPELVIPSSSGRVIPNDKLGGETVVVNQTINVSTGVQATVRNEIRSMMPMLAENAKAAVLDAKRRGGSYGRAMA